MRHEADGKNSPQIMLFAAQNFERKVILYTGGKKAHEHKATLTDYNAYICGKSS